MGFDIECIIDIQTYPGEYFCPVCRTLVYPNEALQSQCTHLYCKPCLAHVANNTRACPYDGYLVTEADSKPLLESDKALAENIGKVVVRCLYHRSGCTWQGQLSECTSHCSTCSFGNSPVVCNRCGIQIIHRQVHEHAQNCPGVNQAQQAPGASQDAAGSVSTGAPVALNQNQSSVVSGVSTSQPQVSQSASATLLPGQDSNQPAAVPGSVPTQEQWYQQQYQQYYQQYAAYQQYYPYQQSTVQPQQQQPQPQPQPQVLAQPQLQSYAQAPVQVPAQPQPQPQVPQVPTQAQSQIHPQSQQHGQSQSQPGQHPPVQAHPQIQPQGQLQTSGYIQPMVPPNLIQPQVNPQKQAYPAMPSHAAAPSQSTLPHGFSAPPSHQYNQPQSHVMQPQQQPQVQTIQYQQSHLQYPQPQSAQPQPQPQLQPLPQFQPQPQPQPVPQPHPQPQPHSQPHSQTLPQSHLQNQPPSQLGNPASLNNPAQLLHTSAHAVSGHQSYPQAQAPQNAQFQQQPFHALPTSGPFPTGQMHGQISQQPALMVPTSSHAPVSSQHVPFASQVQVPALPPSQQQQFHSQVPQMSIPVQQRPPLNSNQQSLPQQYVQQQPLPSTGQAQFPPHSHFMNQQGLHPQPRPQVPPNLMQQSSHGYPQSQQNTTMAPNLRPQPNSTYGGRPMIKGAPVHPQSFAQSSAGFGPASQIRPDHPGSYQQPMTQNTAKNVVSDQHFAQYGTTSGQQQKHADNVSDKIYATKDSGIPSKGSEQSASALRSDSEGPKSFASEAVKNNQIDPTGRNADGTKHDEMLSKDGESEFQGGKDGANELVSERRVKEEATSDSLEHPLNGKSVEASQKGAGSDIVAEDLESQKNEKPILLKESGESLHSTTGPDKGTPIISSPSCKTDRLGGKQTAPNGRPHLHEGRPEQHLQHYGPSTFQQKPSGSVIPQSGPPFGTPPGPPGQLRPDGLGILPQPRSNLNESFPMPLLKQPHDTSFGGIPGPGSMSSHWRGPGHLGAPRAPPLSAVNQRDGIMGRGPQYLSEGQFGPNSGNPAGQRLDHFDGDQPSIPGPLDKRPFGPPPGAESNAFRNNGGQGDNLSSHRSHDERFQSGPTHLNSFSKGSTWPLDQGPRALDRVHGFDFDMDSRFGAGGPPRNMLPLHGSGGFSLNDPRDRELAVGARDNFRGRIDPNGPGGEYFGHATHGFPPGSPRASRGRMGREEFDGRDMRTAGYLRRPEFDGPERQRFGEYVTGGPTPNNFRRADFVGHDIPPGHFRGNSPSHLRFGDPGFGPFPGHAREPLGPGKFHHNMHIGEPFGGNKPGLPHFGEPGFRSSFSLEERRKDGHYAADMDPFDKSRKRKPPSMGWCRICEVDCETVEGLDMHSQTREHQKMAMDMVKAIKQQNKKKPRFSNARAVREEANKARNSGVDGRGGIIL